MFWFRCLAVLELPGAVFFVGMERDARGRWHRSGEWMQAGVFLRFCGVDGEGRQRKVASLRAGTPSGDTTRAPGDG